MRSGRLDRRLTIQAVTETRGSAGDVVETWADVATVWAEKMDEKGREYFAAAQVTAERPTRFTIRWRSGLTAKHRVVCEGVTYDVQAIDEIGRRKGLWLYCLARGQ